ncbi:unnamed protein product [Calypogeia fissa]
MASSVCLRGVSFFPTTTVYSVDHQSSNELRQCNSANNAEKVPSSGFLGQSLASVSTSRSLSQVAFPSKQVRRLRLSHGARAVILPMSVYPTAPLGISPSADPDGEVGKAGQKPIKKKWRPRRKKLVRSQESSSRATGQDVIIQDKELVLDEDSLLVSGDGESSDASVANSSLDEGNSEKGDRKDVRALDLAQLCWQSGDPLGKKVLGKAVVKWISTGLEQLATEIAQAEQRGEFEEIAEKMSQSGLAFVALAQPYIAEIPMPLHMEVMCLKASTHYPTLFDHFQRQLQEALQGLQSEGLLENWQQSKAWKLLKKHAKSDGHRLVTRKVPELKEIHDDLGLTRETVSNIQQSIEKFVAHAFELLRVERDAELEATQQSLDSAPSELSEEEQLKEQLLHEDDLHPECCDTLHNLTAISSSTGLGGMQLVTLSMKNGHRLPPTALSPGDMVCVRVETSKGAVATECMRGSVYSLGEDGSSIAVAVEARYGDPTFSRLFGRSLRLDRISDLADATTYQRDCQALERLQKHGLHKKCPASPIVATLFGEGPEISWLAQNGPPSVIPVEGCSTSEGTSLDASLKTKPDQDFDESQCKAIDLGLCNQRPVVVIQGPPGTGKTKVVVEIMRKVVLKGEKVLATATTNAAVDNLVERLALAGVNVVRVGNPARVAPAVVEKSLSHIVDSKLEKFRRDLARRRSDLRNDLRQCLGDESMEAGLRQMLKQLGRTLKHKEKELVEETIRQADVVLCTNTGAGDNLVRQVGPFGLVVIDEAGQAIEPSCWIPLLQGKRAVLSGDVCQLAPTVLSREAMEGGLGVSLMERASGLHGGILSTMLQTQYRMHQVIANWSSNEMYGGKLVSSPSVSSRLLADDPEVQATWISQVPLLLLDTRLAHGSLIAGCEEHMDPAGTGSFYNEGEADIVVEHVRVLLAAGVAAESIAVQSPYVAQVQLLRDRVDEIPGAQKVQVASVDSFQGREADAVIVSMVRSNRLGVVGFLGDNRRMNVAITRARKHVAVVCDSTTVGRNAFLRRLLHYIRQHGEVRCAFEGWSISGLLKSRLPTSGSS